MSGFDVQPARPSATEGRDDGSLRLLRCPAWHSALEEGRSGIPPWGLGERPCVSSPNRDTSDLFIGVTLWGWSPRLSHSLQPPSLCSQGCRLGHWDPGRAVWVFPMQGGQRESGSCGPCAVSTWVVLAETHVSGVVEGDGCALNSSHCVLSPPPFPAAEDTDLFLHLKLLTTGPASPPADLWGEAWDCCSAA